MNTTTSVLVVDDDVELCRLLRDYLSWHSFEVESVRDGLAALSSIFVGAYDIVVLDVMLPRMDGFEVLRQIRRRSAVPVVLLTARAEETDRLRGFEVGADDYLLKPFAPAELLARIRAVLRRVNGAGRPTASALRVGPIVLNPVDRRAWIDDVETELTTMEFDLLELLMAAAGRIVSRDEIAAVLYQREASPFERSVDVHVSHLRKKLAPHGDLLLRTVRGVGYLFSTTA